MIIKGKNLSLLFIMVLLLSICTVQMSYAEANNLGSMMDKQNTLLEESYTFRVADKLIGKGVVKLSLGKNEFTGTATGTGKILFCKVDVNADIVGVVNDTNRYIGLTITGIGDPRGRLIPGKVSFYGPLKGSFQNEKIILSGKINIIGWLRRFARLKRVEDLFIEIPYQSFAKIVN